MDDRICELVDRYWSESLTDREVRDVEFGLEGADCLEFAKSLKTDWDRLATLTEPPPSVGRQIVRKALVEIERLALDTVGSRAAEGIEATATLERGERAGEGTSRRARHTRPPFLRAAAWFGLAAAAISIVALVQFLRPASAPQPQMQRAEDFGAVFAEARLRIRDAARFEAALSEEPEPAALSSSALPGEKLAPATLMQIDLLLHDDEALPRLRYALESSPDLVDRARAFDLLNLARDRSSIAARAEFVIELLRDHATEKAVQGFCLGSLNWYLDSEHPLPENEARDLADNLLEALDRGKLDEQGTSSAQGILITISNGEERDRLFAYLRLRSDRQSRENLIRLLEDLSLARVRESLDVIEALLDTDDPKTRILRQVATIARRGDTFRSALSPVIPLIVDRLAAKAQHESSAYSALGQFLSDERAFGAVRDAVAARNETAILSLTSAHFASTPELGQRRDDDLLPPLLVAAKNDDPALSKVALVALAAMYEAPGALPLSAGSVIRSIAENVNKDERTRAFAIRCLGPHDPSFARSMAETSVEPRLRFAALDSLRGAMPRADWLALLADLIVDTPVAENGSVLRGGMLRMIEESESEGGGTTIALGTRVVSAIERLLEADAAPELFFSAFAALRAWNATPGADVLSRLASADFPTVAESPDINAAEAQDDAQKLFAVLLWTRLLRYAEEPTAENADPLAAALDATSLEFRARMRSKSRGLAAVSAIRGAIDRLQPLTTEQIGWFDSALRADAAPYRIGRQEKLRQSVESWLTSRDRALERWSTWVHSADTDVVRKAIAMTPALVGAPVERPLLDLLDHAEEPVVQDACGTLRFVMTQRDADASDLPRGCDRTEWEAAISRCSDEGCTPIRRITTAVREGI